MKPESISDRFGSLREGGHRALITYVMAGDPDLERSGDVVRALADGGADLIELGFPFSDPLADGPAIQAAGQRALAGGFLPDHLFGLVRDLRRDISIPIIIMTYYNPIFRYGVEEFVRAAADAGVSGLIVPDVPYEESDPLFEATKDTAVDLVFLAAPTTPRDRMRLLGERTRGFLYYVSRTGVTGERKSLADDLEANLRWIREEIPVPVGVGFGISNADQAKTVARLADGVIIGSAIVRIVEKHGNHPDLGEKVKEFVRPIAEALHSGTWPGRDGTADSGKGKTQAGRLPVA
jgi:tryptophan synthase alpha chain